MQALVEKVSSSSLIEHEAGTIAESTDLRIPDQVFERAAFDLVTCEAYPALSSLVEACQFARRAYVWVEQEKLKQRVEAAYDQLAVPAPPGLKVGAALPEKW